MFYIPLRRGHYATGRRRVTCTWGPEQPGRTPKSKSRFYNKSTGRWEWRYCY